jgi:hypothetical protein
MRDCYLLCAACVNELRLHPEDRDNGIQERRVAIAHARRPPGLARTITTFGKQGEKEVETELVRTLECDTCSAEIEDGQPCTAVTHWRGTEPEQWEREYGAT